jgi:hypothetical protein
VFWAAREVKFGLVNGFWEFFRVKSTKSYFVWCVFVCVIFQNKNIVFRPFQPLSMKLAGVLYQKKNMRAGSFSEIGNPGRLDPIME